jgi:hypothetical protein
MVEYQYRVMIFPSGVSPGDLCRAVTQEAEYGHWELSRLRLYLGGARKVWLRRQIIRVQPPAPQGTVAHQG